MVSSTNSGFKRVWFITGASRGLGALIAQAALADGNAVVATGRNVAAIAERSVTRRRSCRWRWT